MGSAKWVWEEGHNGITLFTVSLRKNGIFVHVNIQQVDHSDRAV
jgi:hypothetical protein